VAPLQTSSGEFVGTISFVLNIDFSIQKIASVKIGETGLAFMGDKDGINIAAQEQGFHPSTDMKKQEGMKRGRRQHDRAKTGAETYVFKG